MGDGFVKVVYRGEIENVICTREEKYLQINEAVGDTIEYSMLGALLGTKNMCMVQQAIKSNKFNFQARYLWNRCVNILASSHCDQQELLEIMYQFIEYCFNEHNTQYLLCGYILFAALLRNDILKMNKNNSHYLTEMIINLIVNIDFITSRHVGKLRRVLSNVIYECLEYVKFGEEDIDKLLSGIRWEYLGIDFADSVSMLAIINKVLNKTNNLKKIRQAFVRWQYFDEFVEKSMFYFERHRFMTRDLTKVLEDINEYIVFADITKSERIFDMCLDKMVQILEKYSSRDIFSFQQKILIIKNIYRIYINESMRREDMWRVLNGIVNPINIKKLFITDQNTFDEFMVLLNQGIFDDYDYVVINILDLINRNSDKLTIRTYNEIKVMAKRINCKTVLNALDQLI